MAKKLKKRLIFGGIILVIAAIAIISRSGQPVSVDGDTAVQTVETIRLADSAAGQVEVKAIGEIRGAEQITLRSEANVPVSRIFVRPGDTVIAGQPILEFERSEFDADLARAAGTLQRAEAQLSAALNPRTEDVLAAEIAVDQAKIQLASAQESADTTIESAENAVNALYENTAASLASGLQAARDALALLSETQVKYFNCSNNQICFRIADAKADAVRILFDESNGGRWAAQTIRTAEGELVETIQAISATDDYDGRQLRSALQDLLEAMKSTRSALANARDGLDTILGANASAAEKAAIEGERAAIEAQVSALNALLQQFENIEGGVLGENSARKIEEARSSALRSVALAEAQLAAAENTLNKLTSGPNQNEFLTLQAGIIEARASYERLLAGERRYTLRAPFSGTVAALTPSLGDLVQAGQAVATIVSEGFYEAETFISADQRKQISIHSEVLVDGVHPAIVTYVAPGIDEVSRKVKVGVAILDTVEPLTIGETVEISFSDQLEGSTGFIIPLGALKTTPNGTFVMANENGKVREYSVEILEVFGDSVQIAGDNLPEEILSSVRGLTAGDSVN
jgi:multidrug efflux pump subunit AcrA (membrane-fusion protein)